MIKRLDKAETTVASMGTDVLVIFRLLAGQPYNIPLVNLASYSYQDEPRRRVIAQMYVRGRILNDLLTVFPEQPETLAILIDNGWGPVDPKDFSAGYVLR